MSKRKTCLQVPMSGGRRKEIHKFLNEKPFDWQYCHCKKYTFFQLKERNRQRLIEQQGEGVPDDKQVATT